MKTGKTLSKTLSRHALMFDELRDANIARLPQFKDAKGRKAHAADDGSDWSPSDWTNALSGESGEASNITKKIRRGDYVLDDRPPEFDGATVREALAKELADVVCYADLTALSCRIDLGDAVVEKFNEVSDRIARIAEKRGDATHVDVRLDPAGEIVEAAVAISDELRLLGSIADEWERRARALGWTDDGDAEGSGT